MPLHHARLSPSARVRWQKCPASVAACAKYEGSGRSGAAAIDGTHSHTLLEHCLKAKGGIADPKQFLGTVLQDAEGMFAPDQARVERVRVAVDYIKRRLAELGEGSTVISERRVNPEALVGRDDMHGTVDVQIISGSQLEIIDYKDGMQEVIAKDNPQLEQYLVGVLAEVDASQFEKMTMTIIQPKLALRGGEPISSHTIEVDAVWPIITDLSIEAARTDDPNAPFVPGEKQCGWCAHKGNCSAFNKHSLEAAGIKFEDMNFAREAAEKNPAELDDEQLRELVEAAPLLRKMIEAAEGEALRRISTGHPVAGLKVVRGPGRRAWSRPDDEVAGKLTKMGVPKTAIYETVLVSPAKAEKLTWTKRDGTEKQLTERQLEVLHKELVTKGDGKLTVVPEADKRAAVDYGDLAKMFTAVPAAPEAPTLPSWLS
jgi:hypothetical protein